MRNPIICLTCGTTYPSHLDRRLTWRTSAGEVGPPPPIVRRDSDRAARRAWLAEAYLLHCENGHLMPGTDGRLNELLVMSLFGEKAAGKGALLRGLERHLSAGKLRPRGIRGALRKDQEARFDQEYPDRAIEPTQRATKDKPRVPIYFDLTATGGSTVAASARSERRIDLAVFDTGWEDQQTVSGAATAAPFISETDIVVFVVPPASLDGLPDTVRRPADTIDVQDPKRTQRGISTVVTHLTDKDLTSEAARKQVTVIIALSKCDRYVGVDAFPSHLLRDRDYAPGAASIGAQMADEQAELNEFMLHVGGLRLLDTAAEINGTVSIHAISGTGADDPRRAPAPHSAPNRSLDPLVLGLLRAGVGDLGSAMGR